MTQGKVLEKMVTNIPNIKQMKSIDLQFSDIIYFEWYDVKYKVTCDSLLIEELVIGNSAITDKYVNTTDKSILLTELIRKD